MPLSNALYSNSLNFIPVLAWFLFTGGQMMLTIMSLTQFDLRQVFFHPFNMGVSSETDASVYPFSTCPTSKISWI